jgi:hypothetical protein
MRVRTFGRIENMGTNDSDHLNGFDGTDLPFGNGGQDCLYGGGGKIGSSAGPATTTSLARESSRFGAGA